MTTMLGSNLTAEDRESIRRMTEEGWTAAGLAQDWDKAIAMCAPDIVYMPADHPVLRGHAALRTWFDQFPRIVKFSQPLDALEGQGTLAMARGTFAVTVDVGGQLIANTGKVLVSWTKDDSGRWLAKAVCWNWDRPLGSDA